MSHALYAPKLLRQKIVALTQRGNTAPEIAAMLNCTVRTVQRHRRAAGLTSSYHFRVFTPEEDARALAMLADGASYAEVGRTLGRGYQGIARRFPGYSWTPEQTIEYRTVLKAFNAIGTRPLGVFA